MPLQAFIKIDGIVPANLNGIALESFSWSVSNSGLADAGGGIGAGKVSLSDFTFTSNLGNHSPQLFIKCVEGYHIQSAMLSLTGGPSQITIKFADVLISGYKLQDESFQKTPNRFSAKEDFVPVPQESVSLNFAKVEYSFGSTTGGYDIGSQKAG